MHGLEAEYWGRVDFLYINRELPANREVVDAYQIRSQPVIVLLDANGNEVQRLFGGISESELRAVLDSLLAGSGG